MTQSSSTSAAAGATDYHGHQRGDEDLCLRHLFRQVMTTEEMISRHYRIDARVAPILYTW
jgi:hypothetical protein